MEAIIDHIYNIIWSPALFVLLLGAGLYFTLRTRCVQVRKIKTSIRLLFPGVRKKHSKGFTSFEAFCVALSGRVGTGNIVGVATAIALGGPGAVFWMWVVAFLGASTAFMESTLAQLYKFKDNNKWHGGPACYIHKGLGMRWLSILFIICTMLGYGTFLVMVQANSIAEAFENSFSVPDYLVGIAAIILVGLVVVGGMKRIARFASIVTPFMALGYILMSIIILSINWRSIPSVFETIFSCAFGVNQMFSGLLGGAISMGVKRGLFSNEAGQGGGAIVSASADVEYPAQQGIVQAFSVYVDTLLVCTATALMILCTGSYNVFNQATGDIIHAGVPELGNNYVAYTQHAVDSVFVGFGGIFVAVALTFFVFTTLIAYYFYSDSSILYLCRVYDIRKAWKKKLIVWVYRVFLFSSIIIGACFQTDLIWKIGDIGLGLTTWINVIALLFLCPRAIRALKRAERHL